MRITALKSSKPTSWVEAAVALGEVPRVATRAARTAFVRG